MASIPFLQISKTSVKNFDKVLVTLLSIKDGDILLEGFMENLLSSCMLLMSRFERNGTHSMGGTHTKQKTMEVINGVK